MIIFWWCCDNGDSWE